MTIRTAAIGLFASLSMIGAALAQTPPAPAPTVTPPPAAAPAPAAPAKAAKEKKPRSAESIACSQKADEAGLKGKEKRTERRSFRRKCMQDMKKAAAAAPAAPAPAATAPAAPAKKN